MNSVREWLVGFLSAIYRPAEKMALEIWAEANIVLSPKESVDNPGPYKKHHAIYAPRLMDLFFGSSEWRSLMIQKSSQSGLTLHALIQLCRVIKERSTSILYVIDSATKARDLSKTRFKPMLASCKCLALDVEASEDEMNTLTYELPAAIVRLVGAGSAGQVASNPIDIAVGDEIDKWKEPKTEATIWDLLVQRIKKSEFGKALGYSTPTVETAVTHQMFLTGSRHRYFVPCPHCGHFQLLNIDRLKFGHCKDASGKDYDLNRVLAETYVECEGCQGRIEEDHKLDMMLAGEWRATNYKEIEVDGEKRQVPAWTPGEMSAHISDFYTMHPASTWGVLAFEWIRAQGRPKKMQNWLNGRAGEPVKQSVSSINQSHILRLRGSYKRGALPIVPCVLTMQVDNQGDHQKWTILGMLPNGTMYVVDWGKTLDLSEIKEIYKKPIRCGDKDCYIGRVIIDEGGKGGTSYDVRSFCLPFFPAFIPAKGRGGIQVKNTITFSDSSVDRGGQDKIPVCHFDDDSFKRKLYIEMIRKFDPQKCADYDLGRIWLPVDVSAEFVRELCGEELIKELDANGVAQFVWKPKPPNDYGDCLKMGLVLWNVIAWRFGAGAKV